MVEKTCADGASDWIRSGEELVLILNSGPGSDSMELRVAQPLSEGIISMVNGDGQPILEESVFAQRSHTPNVDISENQSTYYIAAVPHFFRSSIIGVVSAVQITKSAT